MLQLLIMLLVVAVLQASHAFQSPTSSSFHRQLHQQGNGNHNGDKITSTSLFLSSSDIQAKLKAQMAKLQERDRASVAISPDVSFL